MPRFGKRDLLATQAMRFKDDRSFVALDGTLRLYGADWKEQVQRVWFRDKGICQWCSRLIDAAYEIWDADHKVKRSKGGSDDLDNLRLIHRHCHIARHPEFQPQWGSAQAGG